MMIEAWPLYVAAVLVAAISPGPNVLIVMMHSLRYGWRMAIWTIAGNLVCLFLVACLAALGIGAILQAQPILYTVLKTMGGAYLIWMGFKILKASVSQDTANFNLGEPHPAHIAPTPFSLMRQAFLVSAANPKSVLFLSAVFPQFLDHSFPLAPQFAVMFVTLLVIVFIIHGVYGLAAAGFRQKIVRPHVRKWMSRMTGGSFVALGAGVLVSRQ